jgi:hypothetical protein
MTTNSDEPPACVERIPYPSGGVLIGGAAGDGWVLGCHRGGVVAWSPATGFLPAAEHPPFVNRIVAVPGGFLVFADDGGIRYLGFYSTDERRFAWWQAADAAWREISDPAGDKLFAGDLVLCSSRRDPRRLSVLHATPSGLRRLGAIEGTGLRDPRFAWRCPRTGDLFLGTRTGLYRAPAPSGEGSDSTAVGLPAPLFADVLLVSRDGTVVLEKQAGWPKGYSLATGASVSLPAVVTRSREAWDAFVEGRRGRVARLAALLSGIERDEAGPGDFGVTFVSPDEPVAVRRRGIFRIEPAGGVPPPARDPLFPPEALASWPYLAGADGGREAAFAALASAQGSPDLADALVERDGPGVFLELGEFVRTATRSSYRAPGDGVALVVDRLGRGVEDEVLEALHDTDPAVAAVACAGLRSPRFGEREELRAPSGLAYRRLVDLLGSDAPGTVREAHATLRKQRLPIPAPVVRTLLLHEESFVRTETFAGVREASDGRLPEAFRIAIGTLLRTEREAGARESFAFSLAMDGAFPSLLALAAADASPDVRKSACGFVPQLGGGQGFDGHLALVDAVVLSRLAADLRERRTKEKDDGEPREQNLLTELVDTFQLGPPGGAELSTDTLDLFLSARAGQVTFGVEITVGEQGRRLLERVGTLLAGDAGLAPFAPDDLVWVLDPRAQAMDLVRFGAKVATRPSLGFRVDALGVLRLGLEKGLYALAGTAPRGSLAARLRDAGVPPVVREARSRLRGNAPGPTVRALALAALAVAGQRGAREELRSFLVSGGADEVPVAIPVLLELAPDDSTARGDLREILLAPGLPLARRWQLAASLGAESRIRFDDLGPETRRAFAAEVAACAAMPFPERRLAGRQLAALGDPEPLRALWAARSARPGGLGRVDRGRREEDEAVHRHGVTESSCRNLRALYHFLRAGPDRRLRRAPAGQGSIGSGDADRRPAPPRRRRTLRRRVRPRRRLHRGVRHARSRAPDRRGVALRRRGVPGRAGRPVGRPRPRVRAEGPGRARRRGRRRRRRLGRPRRNHLAGVDVLRTPDLRRGALPLGVRVREHRKATGGSAPRA